MLVNVSKYSLIPDRYIIQAESVEIYIDLEIHYFISLLTSSPRNNRLTSQVKSLQEVNEQITIELKQTKDDIMVMQNQLNQEKTSHDETKGKLQQMKALSEQVI